MLNKFPPEGLEPLSAIEELELEELLPDRNKYEVTVKDYGLMSRKPVLRKLTEPGQRMVALDNRKELYDTKTDLDKKASMFGFTIDRKSVLDTDKNKIDKAFAEMRQMYKGSDDLISQVVLKGLLRSYNMKISSEINWTERLLGNVIDALDNLLDPINCTLAELRRKQRLSQKLPSVDPLADLIRLLATKSPETKINVDGNDVPENLLEELTEEDELPVFTAEKKIAVIRNLNSLKKAGDLAEESSWKDISLEVRNGILIRAGIDFEKSNESLVDFVEKIRRSVKSIFDND